MSTPASVHAGKRRGTLAPCPAARHRSTTPRVVPLRNVAPTAFNTRPIAAGRLCWIVLLVVFMRARAANKKDSGVYR
jgi:hypothetical protein